MNWELWDRMTPGNSIAHQQRLSNGYQDNRKCTGITWKTTKQNILKQVDKNELQLAMYNNLWTYFICNYMKDKAFLEIKMNKLNNNKLVFATTLCSSFSQWILYADVCLMIHVVWFLIGALVTMFHYKSLVNSYLIFAKFNETLLRPASFLTLVSNYLLIILSL